MKTNQFAARILLCASALFATTAQADLISGLSDFSAAFSNAPTYTFENQGPTSGTAVPDRDPFGVINNPSDGIQVTQGIWWYGSPEVTSYGTSGPRPFASNGTWDTSGTGVLQPWVSGGAPYPEVNQFISIDGPLDPDEEDGSMSIVFDTPVRGVGIFLNFVSNFANVADMVGPKLEARGYKLPTFFTTLQTTLPDDFVTLVSDAIDSQEFLFDEIDGDPLPNQGFYLGFTSDIANISELRLTGANLAAARLYVIPAEIPEPQGLALFAIALAALGFSMKLRGTRPLGRHD